MKFTLEAPSAITIRSVDDGELRIGNDVWAKPVAVTPRGVLDDWRAVPFASLGISDLAPLIASGAELIVIGTGSTQILPGRELMFSMARQGVGLEVMDTAAAARTFNLLVSDGRSVAAVLYV